VRFAIKTQKHDSLWEAWYPLETPKPEKRRTRRLGNHKVSILPIYLSFWAFLGFFSFVTFFTFSLLHFVIFDDFWFYDFCVFVTFYIFHFFLFFDFDDFWSFLLIFSWLTCFWSIFVSKLCAPMMTRFFPSKPALSLSPLLVVKFDHFLHT